MELIYMMTDYVFLTMPVLKFGTILTLLQMALQMYAPVTLLFRAIRRQNFLERMMLSLFPLVFLITGVIMDGLLGSSFLQGGFDQQDALIDYLLNSTVLNEIWLVLAAFPIAVLAVRKWVSRNLFSLLGDIVAWAMFLLCVLVSFFIWRKGAFPAAGSPLADTLALWYVYGVYLLLFQVIISLTAIVWHLLFSKKPLTEDFDVLLLDPEWCASQVKDYFLSGYKVVICSAGPLLLLLHGVLLSEDMGSGNMMMFLIILLPLDAWILYSLFSLIFSNRQASLKRLARWGEGEDIHRQFCREILDPQRPPIKGEILWVSQRFLISRPAFMPVLYYLPLVEGVNRQARGIQVKFRDGSCLKLANIGQRDGLLLRTALEQNLGKSSRVSQI